MNLRAGLDRCGKSRPTPGFDLRTVQLAVSLYTDHAIRAYVGRGILIKNKGRSALLSESDYQGQPRTPQSVAVLCVVCSC